jgi:hypothetical protein
MGGPILPAPPPFLNYVSAENLRYISCGAVGGESTHSEEGIAEYSVFNLR